MTNTHTDPSVDAWRETVRQHKRTTGAKEGDTVEITTTGRVSSVSRTMLGRPELKVVTPLGTMYVLDDEETILVVKR
jgi:hypothetical protein